MITNRNRWIGILLLAVFVSAVGATCVGPTAYNAAVVTATNLDNQFATTGTAMDGLVRTGKITWDQYKPWSDFAGRYKPMSDAAYTALKGTKDAKTTAQATAIINQLESEIAMFLIYSQNKNK
jgi:hypothetical protein